MSEFHPNRTKQIRTKPKLTARRLVECWPLLVWAGVLGVAYWLYSSGVQFTRMNGAVDVYQENAAPTEEGRLLKVHVHRGQRVAAGTLVAEMDASPYRVELTSLKGDVIASRQDDIRDFDLEVIKLESEMREVQVAEAEDSAVIKELEDYMRKQDETARAFKARNPGLPSFEDSALQRIRVDLAKARGRMATHTEHSAKIKESLDRVKKIRDDLGAQEKAVAAFDAAKDDIAKIAPMLRADEYQEFVELNNKIAQCQLKTDRGGIVDRIEKEVGEFVEVGEGVLKIVGDPEHIVCFLPQDQAQDLTVGKKVWVVSTSNKNRQYESEVIGIAPRINNLPDSTSPLPNRRVHGRDVLVKYPDSARIAGGYELLPGQTVIIHIEKPGGLPLLEQIFHNDDNDKTR